MIIWGEIKKLFFFFFQFYFLPAESVLGLPQMVREPPSSVISFLVTVNFTHRAEAVKCDAVSQIHPWQLPRLGSCAASTVPS